MEFDQHLGSHKHVINIIMGFRDMGCYTKAKAQPRNKNSLIIGCDIAAGANYTSLNFLHALQPL
jgi:hypothetical protein